MKDKKQDKVSDLWVLASNYTTTVVQPESLHSYFYVGVNLEQQYKYWALQWESHIILHSTQSCSVLDVSGINVIS